MLEFIFFNDELRERFAEFAHELDVACETRIDELGTVVMLPEDLAEETVDQLEDKYAALMEEQAALADQEAGVTQRQLAGIRVTLSDGSERMIKLDPGLVNRMLECFTLEEVQELVNAIAIGVEQSGDKPLCQV